MFKGKCFAHGAVSTMVFATGTVFAIAAILFATGVELCVCVELYVAVGILLVSCFILALGVHEAIEVRKYVKRKQTLKEEHLYANTSSASSQSKQQKRQQTRKDRSTAFKRGGKFVRRFINSKKCVYMQDGYCGSAILVQERTSFEAFFNFACAFLLSAAILLLSVVACVKVLSIFGVGSLFSGGAKWRQALLEG